ncbi:hypothetical protein, partial [Brucella melitensis]
KAAFQKTDCPREKQPESSKFIGPIIRTRPQALPARMRNNFAFRKRFSLASAPEGGTASHQGVQHQDGAFSSYPKRYILSR